MALITSGRVRQPNGELSIVTDYPFGDVVTVTATFTKAAPLRIRIPGWATKATVDGKPAANGTLHLVQIPAGKATTVTVDFKPEVRVEDGWGSTGNAPAGLPGGMAAATNAATVLRGALVYSLQLVEEFSSIKQWCPPPPTFTSRFRFRARLSTGPFFREPFLNHDYNINTPSTWNYALDLSDPDALTFERAGATCTILQHYGANHLGLWYNAIPAHQMAPTTSECAPAGAPGAIPFNITNYPSVIKAKVVHLPGWVENNQSAANEPPASPIDCKTVAGGCGPAPITVLLVPHGATDLRIAGLPWIAPK